MTSLLAIIIIIAAAVVISATHAGTNASVQKVSASGPEPDPRPPRPHSRGPPPPAMATYRTTRPPAGEPSPIRPRPVPSAHHQVPVHPPNASPSGPPPKRSRPPTQR